MAHEILSNQWADELNALKDKVTRGQELTKSEQSTLSLLRTGIKPSAESALDYYKRLAGEAEARATQTRMDFDAAKRKQIPPWESYDIPWNHLIVR